MLSYGAYVAEVIRAGIESIHPSQIASADALGLSRPQAMRYVVVPQGVRRVIPPLLNDFVSLQKDTALVGVVGVFEAMFAAQDYGNYHFNFTAYTVVAVLLHRADRPAGPLHRLPAAPGDGAGEAGRASRLDVDGALLEVTDLRKTYGDKVVLDDIGLTVAAARRGLPDRLVGLREVDAAALPQPARGHRRRRDRVRGPGDLRPAGRPA